MDRIIVSTGYMGSGSSAITDLVSEFKDCKNEFKSYEYVLMHCPNGVFDLEDKLLLGNNAIRSDEAIRTFYEQTKKLYDKKFWWVGNYKKIISNDFMKITNEYINSLINYNYKGYWYTHEEVNKKMFLKLLIEKPIKALSFNKIKYKDGMKICLPTHDEFYAKTHKYIYNLFDLIGGNEKNIVLDQFLLPFNLYRIDNYFNDDLKVIVVERDPRDVFILNKYIWSQKNYSVPMPFDAEEFASYYKRMRESEIPSNSNKILRVKFEDLIYNYDKELERIMKFLNFKKEGHVRKFSRFNPELSMRNTQLFNNDKYKNEIKILESELKEYLYSFPYKLNNDINDTIEFE